MWGNLSDIGSIIKPVAAVTANSSGTTNSSAIDRQGYESCVLFHSCGAASGSPTAQTADSKLQDSADGSTSWGDISTAAATQLTADSTSARVSVNLRDLTTKRYIRVVNVVALTSGTTPKLPVQATVILGGAATLPAV
jgi:hypothetical protein